MRKTADEELQSGSETIKERDPLTGTPVRDTPRIREKEPSSVGGVIKPIDASLVTQVRADFALYAGFYLVVGGAEEGKTLSCASLITLLNNRGEAALYFPAHEARSLPLNVTPNNTLAERVLDGKPDLYSGGLPSSLTGPVLKRVLSFRNYKGPKVLVIDSVAVDMRFYDGKLSGKDLRKNVPAMQGGLHMCDISYCEECNAIGVVANTAILGVVNDELVPFASKLKGQTEGIITITRSTMKKVDRGSSRKKQTLSFSPSELNDGAEAYGYARREANEQIQTFGIQY